MNTVIANFSQEKSVKLAAVLKGALLAISITLISFLLFSMLIAYSNFPDTFINIIVITTTILSVLVSAMLVSKTTKSGGLVNGLLTGFFYTFIVYCLSGIIYNNYSLNYYYRNLLFFGFYIRITNYRISKRS